RDTLAKRIAGEIVLSGHPGQTMRKWRGLLSVSQIEMANALELSPSVISDYETGRRKSPGSGFIKRYVESLLDIDDRILELIELVDFNKSPIDDIKEFTEMCDIGLIEGGCCNSENVEVLKEFRE
ncbi:MAG: helix-turn-helix domain-containing protein, partial [bacterium]